MGQEAEELGWLCADSMRHRMSVQHDAQTAEAIKNALSLPREAAVGKRPRLLDWQRRTEPEDSSEEGRVTSVLCAAETTTSFIAAEPQLDLLVLPQPC